MPMVSIYTIFALRSGDYKVERSDVSGQPSPPLILVGMPPGLLGTGPTIRPTLVFFL